MGAPPFDMSKMQAILDNPEIRNMAEQMASDPNFQAMTQQLSGLMGAPPGGAPAGGGPPPAGGAAARSAPAAGPGGAAAALQGVDQAQYMEAMQSMLANPQFAKMAEDIGQAMMASDPQMAAMMEAMKDPQAQAQMKESMAALKDDPEVGPLIQELETAGPSAMGKFWNDPVALEKLGKAFGKTGLPGMSPAMMGMMGGPAAMPQEGGEEGEEEDDEDEDEDLPALHKAATDGDVAEVNKLIAGGGKDFNVDEADGQGHSALHLACGYGESDVIAALLDAGASVTCRDKDKNTPLHYAAGYGITDAVRLLLDHGVGLTEKNSDGKTALEVAQMNEQHEIAEMLQAKEGEAFL